MRLLLPLASLASLVGLAACVVQPVVPVVTGSAATAGFATLGAGEYVIPIQQMHPPATVRASDTLRVHLSGTVGPNGCHAFRRVETVKAGSTVRLRAIGHANTAPDVMCTMMIVPLDAMARIAPPHPGDSVTLQALNPDGQGPRATVAVTR